MLNAGNLNRRVRIERLREVTDDPRWGATRQWESIGHVWASVVPLSGSERSGWSGVRSDVLYRVRMRYRSDVTEQDRLVLLNDDTPAGHPRRHR